MAALRPRLTVHIVTRNSEKRLPRLIAEVRSFADEVIVAADASSEDATFEIALALADVVYRFALPQPGLLAPTRMLPFDYARGDWILSLDDDESMEPAFDDIAAELMSAPCVTHYYLARKWIVSEDPLEYVRAHPWYPDWLPRLFRNDRSLLWKPPSAHTLERILGPAAYETRCAILHFEPVWCSPEARAAKVARYHAAGGEVNTDPFYRIADDLPRRPATRRVASAEPMRAAAPVVHRSVRKLIANELPPWSAKLVGTDMPATVRSGERVVVEVVLRNTGMLAWAPTYTQWPATQWPMLRLSYHLSTADGRAVDRDHAPRTLLPHWVKPGADVSFLVDFIAPDEPGEYVIGWDMVSENHCWFSDCGNQIVESRVRVTC